MLIWCPESETLQFLGCFLIYMVQGDEPPGGRGKEGELSLPYKGIDSCIFTYIHWPEFFVRPHLTLSEAGKLFWSKIKSLQLWKKGRLDVEGLEQSFHGSDV